MRYVLLLILVTTTAYADDAAKLRKAAEQLERDGKQSKDVAKLVACGNTYLDLYNRFQGPDGDADLYNAGVCFEEGKSVAAALRAYDLLMRVYRTSKIAPRALARTAKIYADIVQLDRAADRLEEYAKKYAGEKDARDAIADATLYRRALGDREKTIEDTKYFVRTFGAKQPAAAAQAMLSLTSAYDGDRDQQIAHLKEVLKAYKLDAAQQALVYNQLGDLLSASSCPVPLQEGLCVRFERGRGASKPRCAKDAVRLSVAKRSEKYKGAVAAYTAAAKLYDNLPADSPGRYSAAMAKLALVDAELEGLLQRTPPTSKKLDAWLQDATTQTKPINEKYERIIALGEPYVAVVATARVGQTQQAVWRLLRLADGAKDAQVCKVVEERAAPLAQRAGDAFDMCLHKGEQLAVYDGYTRMCLREGQLVDAKRFVARDVHPDPSTIAIAMVPDKIGEADWRAGRKDVAIKAWEAVLAQNAKLFAPRINLAIARFEELRALPAGSAQRKQLAADVTYHAQNAIAIERHAAVLVLLAALALEDKKQYDLATLLADDAVRVNDKYAPAYVALGVIAVRRDRWSTAVAHFERAASLDPASEPVQLALALADLRVGRYDAAATALASIKTATYDVELARGVAARGLGKLDEAKRAYERAIKLDATRTEATQNLGAMKSP